MKINVQQFLQDAGITEPFYPGKRLVQSCRQPGDFKSHCVVLDWRDPERIRIEIKPGLSGKDLAVQQLKEYPVSFQTPTFVEIEVVDQTTSARSSEEEEDEEGEEGKSRGKSGGGSKGQKRKSLSELSGLMNKVFSEIVEGKIPETGTITAMVVMGVEVAKEAYENVFDKLTQQISHAKIATTDLLAVAGKFITRYTPPSFLQPKGNEDKVYKYDAVKNENIGMTGPGLG